jgi:hypothetical protein
MTLISAKGDTGSSKPAEIRRIRELVEGVLGKPHGHIMIAELQCHDDGCPPIETVISILGNENKVFKIAKELRDVSLSDVKKALKSDEQHKH